MDITITNKNTFSFATAKIYLIQILVFGTLAIYTTVSALIEGAIGFVIFSIMVIIILCFSSFLWIQLQMNKGELFTKVIIRFSDDIIQIKKQIFFNRRSINIRFNQFDRVSSYLVKDDKNAHEKKYGIKVMWSTNKKIFTEYIGSNLSQLEANRILEDFNRNIQK